MRRVGPQLLHLDPVPKRRGNPSPPTATSVQVGWFASSRSGRAGLGGYRCWRDLLPLEPWGPSRIGCSSSGRRDCLRPLSLLPDRSRFRRGPSGGRVARSESRACRSTRNRGCVRDPYHVAIRRARMFSAADPWSAGYNRTGLSCTRQIAVTPIAPQTARVTCFAAGAGQLCYCRQKVSYALVARITMIEQVSRCRQSAHSRAALTVC
jgi:hypothetical protein